MSNSRSISLRGRNLAATLLGSLALAALPLSSAHASDWFAPAPPTNCVSKEVDGSRCFDSFRKAVAYATNNLVLDVPEVRPEYYTSTWYILRDRIERANPRLSAIVFSDSNFKGNGNLIIERGDCRVPAGPVWHGVPAGFKGGISLQNTGTPAVLGGIFDNHVNSGVGLNTCLISFHADPDYRGIYTDPGKAINLVNPPLVDQVTSIMVRTPTAS
ncbi:hypothetical protein AB0D37_44100 [Streptomyces sp. NPDC048384]|uniref:hypothetical protein n=1 Tax=Streptomyces sp. NPDC048384 TaxID=3155487 RepID=UPI0034178DEE